MVDLVEVSQNNTFPTVFGRYGCSIFNNSFNEPNQLKTVDHVRNIDNSYQNFQCRKRFEKFYFNQINQERCCPTWLVSTEDNLPKLKTQWNLNQISILKELTAISEDGKLVSDEIPADKIPSNTNLRTVKLDG